MTKLSETAKYDLKMVNNINKKRITQYAKVLKALDKIEDSVKLKLSINMEITTELKKILSESLESYNTITNNFTSV
jgi:hypothetical protein